MTMQRYGDNNTIHHTSHLDIETDTNGKVVSVWFRCMMLPFEQHSVDALRAEQMNDSYARYKHPGLVAVVTEGGE